MTSKDWVQTYLYNADIYDLESMSKRKVVKAKIRNKDETTAIVPVKSNVPQWIKTDPNFQFGVPSNAFNEDRDKIASIVNNDYLKQYLSNNIALKAIEQISRSKITKKDWRNTGYKLRSQTVAQQIAKREQERMQDQRKVDPKVRARKNSTMGLMAFKLPKEQSEYLERKSEPVEMDRRSMQAAQTFLKNSNLPNLSALNKYTEMSKPLHYKKTKRAESTMMQTRDTLDISDAKASTPPPERQISSVCTQPADSLDPFYDTSSPLKQDLIELNKKNVKIERPVHDCQLGSTKFK